MSAIEVGAITDEFSPDIKVATAAMQGLGMQGAELRVINGKNVMDLSDDELDAALEVVHNAGLRVISIASPVLKCTLPDAPPVDPRFQQDIFASKHTF